MDNLLSGAKELLLIIIISAVSGVWWMVRKVFSHDAAFTLLKQDMEHHREITNEIREDVKSLLRDR